ncbi:MAG: ribonuclease H-like domain-containing protein, partial [Candidatus Woesearchaeota archaeon]
MLIFAFSDWRVQNIDNLINYVKNSSRVPDVIVYAGDDVCRFGSISDDIIIEDMVKTLKNDEREFCFIRKPASEGYCLSIKNIKKDDLKKKIYDIILSIVSSPNKKRVVKEFEKVSDINFRDKFEQEHINQINKIWDERCILDFVERHVYTNSEKKKLLKERINNFKIFKIDDNFIIDFNYKPQVIKFNKFEELAKCSKHGVFGIIGNDCELIDKNILNGTKVYDLHDEPKIIGDYVFIGQEGGLDPEVKDGIGRVLYTEKEIKNHLSNSLKKADYKKIILVSHLPPKGVLDLAIRFGIEHIGSKSILDFLNKNKALLNICGHVHSLGGKCKTYEETQVVNIASHDNLGAWGNVAWIDVTGNDCLVSFDYLPPTNLEVIWGVGPRYAQKFNDLGIKTLKEFCETDITKLPKIKQLSTIMLNNLQNQAKSFLYKKAVLRKKLEMKNPVFIDIETDMFQTHVWMICIYDSKLKKYTQFVSKNKKDEKNMLKSFVDFVKKQKYSALYSYSSFDERVLKNVLILNKIKINDLPEFKDFFKIITNSSILPIVNYKLDSVGDFFGYEREIMDISGMQFPGL